MEYGTLKELNVKPGDVVSYYGTDDYEVAEGQHLIKISDGRDCGVYALWDSCSKFKIISRANSEESNERRRGCASTCEVKTWGEMSDAEKGELLLAWQRGGQLQYWDADNGEWESTDVHPFEFEADAYRIKPVEHKRETVTLYGGEKPYKTWSSSTWGITYTHRITFETVDGVPVLDSIKMEEV